MSRIVDLADAVGFVGVEVPVAAAIAVGKTIIAIDHNRVEEFSSPLEHAEMRVIRAALANRESKYLDDAALYVTLEPCLLCLSAAILARIPNIYFGAYDTKNGAVYHSVRNDLYRRDVSVIGGLHEQRCSELLSSFFERKRHQDSAKL